MTVGKRKFTGGVPKAYTENCWSWLVLLISDNLFLSSSTPDDMKIVFERKKVSHLLASQWNCQSLLMERRDFYLISPCGKFLFSIYLLPSHFTKSIRQLLLPLLIAVGKALEMVFDERELEWNDNVWISSWSSARITWNCSFSSAIKLQETTLLPSSFYLCKRAKSGISATCCKVFIDRSEGTYLFV